MREYRIIITTFFLFCCNGLGLAAETSSKVFIIQPKNGDVVDKTFEVIFGIEGITLAPAGTYENNTGHHHLIIDAEFPALSFPTPASENYVHFGNGQDRTLLTLGPGKHSLQLLLGDGNHVPHQPPIASKKIEVVVRP